MGGPRSGRSKKKDQQEKEKSSKKENEQSKKKIEENPEESEQIEEQRLLPKTEAKSVSPEIIKQISEIQMREYELKEYELDVKYKQLQIREKEIIPSREHAKEMMELQFKDREKSREHETKKAFYGVWFLGFVVVACTVVVMTAIIWGKDDILNNIIDSVTKIVLGIFIGRTAFKEKNFKIKDKTDS